MANSGGVRRGIAIDPHVADVLPYAMHVNATIFVEDAISLGNRHTAGQIFLFIHGVELALKSFLAHKNVPSDVLLSKYRHDLVLLLSDSEKIGMQVLNAEDKSLIGELNVINERAAIRYDFAFKAPPLREIQRLAELVIELTRPPLPSIP